MFTLKLILINIITAIVWHWQITVHAAASKLKITVFYESECPDSVSFFKDQLKPNFRPFSRFITLDYIPYGNAEQEQDEDGNWDFTCQHGHLECRENKMQACIIHQLLLKYKRPIALNKFINCYMSVRNKEEQGQKCAKQFKIDFKKTKKCTGSKEGDELLAKMGDRTHNFKPKITWIPTIVFNDTYSQTDQDAAVTNLKKLLCKKLDNKPKPCKQS